MPSMRIIILNFLHLCHSETLGEESIRQPTGSLTWFCMTEKHKYFIVKIGVYDSNMRQISLADSIRVSLRLRSD